MGYSSVVPNLKAHLFINLMEQKNEHYQFKLLAFLYQDPGYSVIFFWFLPTFCFCVQVFVMCLYVLVVVVVMVMMIISLYFL